MPLYKFIERRYFDSFFRTGELKLGTVHGYRDTIEYGEDRGDAEEGTQSVVRRIGAEPPVTVTAKDYEALLSEMLDIGPLGSVQFSGDINVIRLYQSPNAFLFCTSHTYSQKLADAWLERDGLDACYEIVDPVGFVQAVSSKIASSAFFRGTFRVLYRPELTDYRHPVSKFPPGLSKALKYAWQLETRSVWSPLMPSPPLKHWVIDVPEARQFCRGIDRRS